MISFSKRGQVDVTFNWIYVLIAGAVILLFFVGIVAKQKSSSEQKISLDVLSIMESIFTSASVSDKSRHVIDAAGLADYTFYFSCQDGVGEYGIKDSSAHIEDSLHPLFSPAQLSTSTFLTYSLPYALPFKVTDFLFVSSINTKYVVLGNSPFATDFLAQTKEFNVVDSLNNLNIGENYQIRIVDSDGSYLRDGLEVESNLANSPRLSAVQFESSASDTRLFYYGVVDGKWKKLNRESLPLVSIDSERNAAKFAAVFAQDQEQYWCNMQKALKRLLLVRQIYAARADKLKEHYEAQDALIASECLLYLSESTPNIEDSLLSESLIKNCLEEKDCLGLLQKADELRRVNEQMNVNCIALY